MTVSKFINIQKARKIYTCSKCGKKINKGEEYKKVIIKINKNFKIERKHIDCEKNIKLSLYFNIFLICCIFIVCALIICI